MKVKYKCPKCGTENIVSLDDLLDFGMGFSDGMTMTEIGWGGMMSDGNFGGYPQKRPKQVIHECENAKCKAKNTVDI